MQLKGRTFLVTGGTDGIGRELIRQLRGKGANVITTGRTPDRIATTRADGFEVLEADLSNAAGVEALLATIAGRKIDGLINNAGAGTTQDFRTTEAMSKLVDESCIYLNLAAPVRLIAALMPMLRSRPDAMIVNVTSGLAIAPSAAAPVYCATKAGLRSYTLALRQQMHGTTIHVLEVLPPLVDTKMGKAEGMKKMPADICAAQIVRAMERNAHEANIGIVKLLRLAYSISPAFARKIMLGF